MVGDWPLSRFWAMAARGLQRDQFSSAQTRVRLHTRSHNPVRKLAVPGVTDRRTSVALARVELSLSTS